jgi:competence ComEA-like helix-hairpin-helix protein
MTSQAMTNDEIMTKPEYPKLAAKLATGGGVDSSLVISSSFVIGPSSLRQRASILVGLLWCLALVAVVVVGVLHSTRLHLMVGKNYCDKIQARYLALAGIEKAKALLYRDAVERRLSDKNHTGNLYDSPMEFREIKLGPGTFSVIRQGRADEGGGIFFGIADEESRLNINQASPQELGKINGLGPDIIAAIADWKDEDNNVSPGGAEAEYYTSLRPPYLPRNGPFLTIRELLMVRGVSPDLLLGTDLMQNRNTEAEPVPMNEGLWNYFTVDGWTENVNAKGDTRINIQTADESTLTSIRGVTREIAQAITTYRGQKKLENIADLLEVTAPRPQGRGRRAGAAANASGPLVINQELFLEIADSISAETVSEQRGLVNINTAGAQVLAWLPGVTPELAQEIVSYRNSTGFFGNIAWLLKVPGMSRDLFKQLANRVTARSETFHILSEGAVRSNGVRQRLETVVHVSSRDVVTLSWREDL